ncbi:hypothetical protein D3C78_1264180 [compost metagenome]
MQVVTIIGVDQVVGTDEVAQINIVRAEGHRTERIHRRRVTLHTCPGIKRLHAGQRQIVLDHGQALAGQIGGQLFIESSHQHRLIFGVGTGQDEGRVGGFKTVGGPQQIEIAAFECRHHGIAVGETADFDAHAEQLPQQVGVIGGQTFEFLLITGDLERRVIRPGNAHAQHRMLTQPLPVLFIQAQLDIFQSGTGQHLQHLRRVACPTGGHQRQPQPDNPAPLPHVCPLRSHDCAWRNRASVPLSSPRVFSSDGSYRC